jgi:hypothetical protein
MADWEESANARTVITDPKANSLFHRPPKRKVNQTLIRVPKVNRFTLGQPGEAHRGHAWKADSDVTLKPRYLGFRPWPSGKWLISAFG